MAGADPLLLAGGGQLLQRQLADRLEHAEARPVDPDQVLLGERHEPAVAADVGGRAGGPPAREHAEPREPALLGRRQQVVAPAQRVAQRALAGVHVARPVREQLEPALQPGQDLVGVERADVRRRQLDRQREPVEARADPADGLGVGVGQREPGPRGPRPVGEERDRLRLQPQGRHRVLVLAVEVEVRPARREDRQLRRGREQLRHDRRGVEEVLEVVEDQQQVALAHEPRQGLADRLPGRRAQVERLRDRGRDELAVADRRERHEAGAVGEPLLQAAGDLEREPRLARPAGAREREQARARPMEQLAQVLELALAADERAGRGGQPRATAGRRRAVERGVVLEDPALEGLELLAGLEAELLDEAAPRLLERVECLGLATGAIQRQHQLGREALAQRVLAERGREPPGRFDVPALGELALEPPFQRREPQLLEPCDLTLRERLEGEVRQRRPAPQRQRLLVALLGEQPLEAMQVELVVVDPEQVAGRPRLEPVVAQQPPQLGDLAVERGQRRRRRRLTPQRVDERVLRDDLVRPQQQHPEQRTAAAAAEGQNAAVVRHLQRAEDPEVDRCLLCPADATSD